MLGKLIKHEWCTTWKMPTALCGFTVLMTLLGILSFKMPLWQKVVGTNTTAFNFFDMLAIAVLITYFVSLIVSAYAIIIYFAIRFYKNLYTDEGYLMHTLPTTPGKLICSKLIVSGFWNLLASILTIVSVIALMYFFLRTLVGEADWNIVGSTMSDMLPAIDAVFKKYGGISLGFTGFTYVLLLLFGSFCSMLQIYLCICIGQLFKKHKVAASILTYLVYTTVVQTITSIAILPFTFKLMMNMDYLTDLAADPVAIMFGPYASMTPLYYISLVISIILGIASYFVSVYITKRKLNLD